MLDVWTWGALITLVVLFAWSLNHGDWAADLTTSYRRWSALPWPR